MGGHAFKNLHCPRISPSIYTRTKEQTIIALQTLFDHVVVPTEMPEKADYGDIDVLVCSPLFSPGESTTSTFDWQSAVRAIKTVFDTQHGRRGFLNPDCMYFAVPAPGPSDGCWIQVDVKVCFKPRLFAWQTFELHYASSSKMLGSMVKPLGLTVDPEGLHIRVEDMDETNFSGSMVRVSTEARDVLRIAGLDRRLINAGFRTKDELYESLARSWLFNPAHFRARLDEEKYHERLEDRSPHWVYFIKTWVPGHFPDYAFHHNSPDAKSNSNLAFEHADIQTWYKHTRAVVRDKVFTMFPHVAAAYYSKRAVHSKEVQEAALRKAITSAIPQANNGWRDDFPNPRISSLQTDTTDTPSSPLPPTPPRELTPPPTPTSLDGHNAVFSTDAHTSRPLHTVSSQTCHPQYTPLCLPPLPYPPPYPCTPKPPPAAMSAPAKLLCLSRWTAFAPSTGTLCLLSAPRDRHDCICWADAVDAGATVEQLAEWAREMWWCVWVRQCWVNYVGMWRRRFEREAAQRDIGMGEEERRETIRERLRALNERVGRVGL
ncbi:hypothetical protein ACN47E_007774 [Coniothyrium glycines]